LRRLTGCGRICGHQPGDRTALTLDAYLAARHLVVTPWNEQQGVLDCELERQGYSRQVNAPSMLSAPFIIEQSDLLMALPRRAAETMARAARLTIFPLPFPPFDVKIYAHQRSGKREATRWLISLLQTLVGVAAAS
jgi:DNA-binding transcriptional LysR family regulator